MNKNHNAFQPVREEFRDPRQRYLMDVARLAYIYGFPSYRMARMRFRALVQPHARLNSLHHVRQVPSQAASRVGTGNSELLTSAAWLDLSREPLIIHVPGPADRYYSLALIDMFSNNFAVLGRRSAGSLTGDFLVAGPQWEGAAPAATTVIRAPTNAVWAVVRILVYGPTDLASAHMLQEQFAISRSGLRSVPAPRSPHPVSSPVAGLNIKNLLTFFDILNSVLTENPPPARDQPILDRLRTIGVGPSLRFSHRGFTPPQLDALKWGIGSARDAIGTTLRHARQQAMLRDLPLEALLAQLRGPADASQTWTRSEHGWSRPPPMTGDFGTDYLRRARYAHRGIGGLPSEDAIYFNAATDAEGAPFNGRYRYVLRFLPAALPPVNAFWSLIIHQIDGNDRRSPVSNENNRYSLGNYTPGLRYGRHGSLKILIQHERPTTNEGNWLPAPEGPFQLTLRAYLPRRELLDGTYPIPAVQIDNETTDELAGDRRELPGKN